MPAGQIRRIPMKFPCVNHSDATEANGTRLASLRPFKITDDHDFGYGLNKERGD
jgi:hypothetical protein